MEPQKIPSEIIEPQIQWYLRNLLIEVGEGHMTPAEAKLRLQYISSFIDQSCGIHAQMSTTNSYYKFIILEDDQLYKLCKQVVDKNEEFLYG